MKRVVMLGTAFDTKGGISAVVNVYRAAGLFDLYPVTYVATHRDGSGARKLATLLGGWLRFVALLVTGRVALAHVHTSFRASFWRKSLFFLPCFAFGVPVVLHLHSGGFAEFYEKECGPRRQAFIRWVFRRCDAIVTLSEERRHWIEQAFGHPDVSVVFNPVITEPLRAGRDAPREPRIVCMGRLGRNKGSYDLVDALVRLRERWPAVRLVLGGDGEIEQVRAHAAARGVAEHVQTLGWVSAADRQREFEAAAVYALPSYHEAMPMSVLEAMSAALPVVSTRVGGIPDIVSDEVDGLLVAPGDVEALAHALARVLDDPALARRLGDAAHARIERTFGADVIVPKIEHLYERFGIRRRDGGTFVPGREASR